MSSGEFRLNGEQIFTGGAPAYKVNVKTWLDRVQTEANLLYAVQISTYSV